MTGAEVTAAEAAALANIAESTWRAYVARGEAPSPIGYSSKTGRRVWSTAVVRAWLVNRPGPGHRTDLHQPRPNPRPAGEDADTDRGADPGQKPKQRVRRAQAQTPR